MFLRIHVLFIGLYCYVFVYMFLCRRTVHRLPVLSIYVTPSQPELEILPASFSLTLQSNLLNSGIASFSLARSLRALSWRGVCDSLPCCLQPVKVPRAGLDLFSPRDLSRPRLHRPRDTRSGGDRSLLILLLFEPRCSVCAILHFTFDEKPFFKRKKIAH